MYRGTSLIRNRHPPPGREANLEAAREYTKHQVELKNNSLELKVETYAPPRCQMKAVLISNISAIKFTEPKGFTSNTKVIVS